MAERRKKHTGELAVYTDEQLEQFEKYIEDNFGEIDQFFQEKVSENIKLNFYVIAPGKKRRFYTIITGGMGAWKMNVPKELGERRLERAEFIINLPPYWKFEEKNGSSFWPIRLLDRLAHLPIKENAWLGFGHTIDYGEGFSDDTGLCSVLITRSSACGEPRIFRPSDDVSVNLYQLITMYRPELEFKIKNGIGALFDSFPEFDDFISEPDRPCYIPEDFENIIDTVEMHSSKIRKKNLNIPEINGANHIAAFLMWAIGKKLISEEMEEFFDEEFVQLRKGLLDPRKFLINTLGGELTMELFNSEGQQFIAEYYDFYGDTNPSYPGDVDSNALKYFGEEKYNCAEFDDEAYLFVPFGDDYCKAMNRYINKKYRDFKKRKSISEQDLTNS